MSFTRSDVITRARDRINTQAATILDAARLYRSYNDVARGWARQTRCLSSETTATLTATQQIYSLAGASGLVPKAYEVRKVRILTSVGSTKVEVQGPLNLDRFYQSYEVDVGPPQLWGYRGTSQIILWPTPAATIANGLFLDTYNLPADISESLGVITGATNNNPIVYTSVAHGLTTGQLITVAGVLGNLNANVSTPTACHVLSVDTFTLPVTGSGAYTSGGTFADATPLEFPDSHRDGLVCAMALAMCRMDTEDPYLFGRIPDLQMEYAHEMKQIAEQEARPSSRAGSWGSAGARRSGDRYSGRLPSTYGPEGYR